MQLAEDTIFIQGGTIGGSNEYGGLNESGGAGTATAIEGSGQGSQSTNEGGRVTLPVPEPPNSPIVPIVLGFIVFKYLGVF